MTYEFTTDKVGKMTLNNFGSYGKTFTLHGIDAQQSDANITISKSTTTYMNLKQKSLNAKLGLIFLIFLIMEFVNTP